MTIFNEFIDRFLQNNSTKQCFQHMEVDIHVLTEQLPHSKLIPVTIINNIGQKTETVEYLIKMAPGDHTIRRNKPYDKLYHREWFIYTDCLPEFEKFERESGLAVESMFQAFPKCYAISLRPFEESMVLEYLEGEKHFHLWDKKLTLSDNHIKLVLQEYAKLHAISFAIRKKRPAFISYIEKNSKDLFMEILQRGQGFDNIEIVIERLTKIEEICENEEKLDKLKFLKKNIIKIMTDLVHNNSNSDKNVLLYGGNCFNDLMFKYKDPTTKSIPIEVKFTDWQKSRFGSQALDIACFLYTSLQASSLANLEEFLAYYHDHFIKHGELLNFSLSNVYSFQDFYLDWKKYSIFVLGFSIFVMYKIYVGRECAPMKNFHHDENKQNECLLSSEQIVYEAIYLKRILELFNHFVDKELL